MTHDSNDGFLAEVVAGQNARSALIRQLIREHLATCQPGARGPSAADLATWLRTRDIYITPDGVRSEVATMIRDGEVSRHKRGGSWRYTVKRGGPDAD